jgi:membrane-associated phospholipid phosphatase
VQPLDLRAFLAIYGGSSGPWGPAMLGLTVLGAGYAAWALLPFALWRRTRRFALALAAAVATQAVLVWALKALLGRVRPWLVLGLPAPWGHPHDGSFPSGHAAGSFCVAAFLVAALPALPAFSRRTSLARALSFALSLAVIALAGFIALSRVYLGAHFPSDVLAGALLGGAIGARAGQRYAAQRAILVSIPGDYGGKQS